MVILRELMSATLVTVAPDTTVAEAATVMGTHQVGSAIVLVDDALAGIFTERDVMRAVGSDFDAAHHKVSEFMTSEPSTADPTTGAREALDTMLRGGFRHLPVVEGGRVVGVVSMRDLTAALDPGRE